MKIIKWQKGTLQTANNKHGKVRFPDWRIGPTPNRPQLLTLLYVSIFHHHVKKVTISKVLLYTDLTFNLYLIT